MAKSSTTFTCTACGASHSKWIGKCEGCGAWNTLVEEVPLSAGPKALGSKGKSIPLTDLATQEASPPRAASGINELDRVLNELVNLNRVRVIEKQRITIEVNPALLGGRDGTA